MPRRIKEVAIGTLVHGGVEVLLGKKEKKRSEVQHGSPLRWVFYGGKIERGESTKEAFLREFQQESGLIADPGATEQVAIILMHKLMVDGSYKELRIHVFLTRKAKGVLRHTDEMEGWRWCNQAALPHYAMLAADPKWMPLVFGGKKVIARVVVDKHQRYLLRSILVREVKNFPALCPEDHHCPPLI